MADSDGTTLVVEDGLGWGSAAEELNAENSNQGFGYIGKVRISFGFKCFIKEVSNTDSFFEFVYKNPESEKAARDKAVVLLASHGVVNKDGEPSKPQAAFAIHLYKSGVLSKDSSSWLEDKWWVYPLWTPNWKEIVLPALEKLKLKVGNQDVWGQVRFKNDPSGKMHEGKDREGNAVQQHDLVFYLAEVYASEADAKSHVRKKEDAPASSSGKPTFPKGYTEAAWNTLAEEIKLAYTQSKQNTPAEEFDSAETISGLSGAYGLVETWIRTAVGLKG